MFNDVHQFSGHIACVTSSNSEIVLPIRQNNQIIAVLDIDSPDISRFDLDDKSGLSQIVEILQTTLCHTDEVEVRSVVQ